MLPKMTLNYWLKTFVTIEGTVKKADSQKATKSMTTTTKKTIGRAAVLKRNKEYVNNEDESVYDDVKDD